MDKILRPDKPTLTGSNASTLHTKLIAFKVYFNEAQEINKSRWFRAARAVASGRARATLESVIVQDICGETKYQELRTTPKADCWNALWEKSESKLKMVAGLDESPELNEADRKHGKVVLQRSATISQLEEFAQASFHCADQCGGKTVCWPMAAPSSPPEKFRTFRTISLEAQCWPT